MMKKYLCLFLLLALLLCGCVQPMPEAPTQPPLQTQAAVSGGEELFVHFIDVGQADCALLEYDGEYMLIDGGNRDDAQLVVSYLEQQGVQELSAVVCSHAHEDHVGGLPSVLAVYPTGAVYAPTRTYSSKVFDDFVYYTDQQGLEIIIPEPGDTIPFAGVEVTVLGPVMSYAETNDTSIVLRVDHGEASFLFTGDMEVAAENDMLDYWEDRGYEDAVKVDVLKVGHHGSDTSSSYRLLYAAEPAYGIISCGKDNSYGHPHEEPLSRLKQAEVTLLRTDELGHIIASTDGGEVRFIWQNQSAQPEDVEPGEAMHYIGNKNSGVFHTPYCSGLPAEKNRVELESYEQAIEEGYRPCSSCLG